MSRIVVVLIWLLHWLPLPLLALLGRGFGRLLYVCVRRRRHIVAVNLRMCFPELDDVARRKLAKAHFEALGRSLLERGLVWWADEARLRRIVRVENAHIIQRLKDEGRPMILLSPHFVGLDIGATRLAMDFDAVSIYARQKDPVFDYWLHYGRQRFGNQRLLSREDGLRTMVRAMKDGHVLYYLPDMNFRTKDVVFVPFFGVPAATITGLSRIARLADAVVVPCPTRMLPGGQGYVVEIDEPWEDFPTRDVEPDIARMNRWIEAKVRTMPEQYYWVHRRFKTRPPGEKKPY